MIENYVLSALYQNFLPDFIFSEIEEKHFLSQENVFFFQEAKKIWEAKNEITFSTLPSEKIPFFCGILEEFPTISPSFVFEYVEGMKKEWFQRFAKKELAEISALSASLSVEEIAKRTEAVFSQKPTTEKKEDIFSDTTEFFEEFEKRVNGEVKSVRTIPFLDELVHGFEKKELVVVAGRPATGKTAFALQMAVESAKNGSRVLFVSLEMSKNEVIARIVSRLGKIPNWKCHKGQFQKDKSGDFLPKDAEEISRVGGVIDEIRRLPLSIFSEPIVSCQNILAKILKMEREGEKPDIVIVDYLQLLHNEGKNQYERITKISRDLKILAGQANVPVVALCQFNRDASKSGKRPELHDLKDSGSIEQDANSVIALWSFQEDEDEEKTRKDEKSVNISVLKSRNGRCGMIEAKINFVFQNFEKTF